MKTVRTVGAIKSGADHFSIRSSGDDFAIRGYASTPTLDRYNEVVDVAAFKDGLANFARNPVMLNQHNPKEPIGWFRDLQVRPTGLWVEGVVGRGFEPADTVRAQIAQGIVRCFSIGFRETKRGTTDTQGVYHITGLELLEISVVSIPACAPAEFTHDGSGKLCEISLRTESRAAARGLSPRDRRLVAEIRLGLASLLTSVAARELATAERRQGDAVSKLQNTLAGLHRHADRLETAAIVAEMRR